MLTCCSENKYMIQFKFIHESFLSPAVVFFFCFIYFIFNVQYIIQVSIGAVFTPFSFKIGSRLDRLFEIVKNGGYEVQIVVQWDWMFLKFQGSSIIVESGEQGIREGGAAQILQTCRRIDKWKVHGFPRRSLMGEL